MIGSSENRISYNGNGIATEFAYNFIIIEKSDIKVLHVAADGTEQLLTKDYYVDMEKSVVLYPGYAPGAEIPEQDRPPVLPVGERLVIYREVPITQASALDKHWPFNVIEDGLDKLTIICQQIWDRLQRSFYVSESTSTNFDTKVPIEAGKTFRVKDDGTGFEVTEDPGKVIDGATALLEQTTEQANIAVASSASAQNAANAAEAVAPEYAKTKEVLDNIVSYTNTATEQASIATAKANIANVSATNAAQSYANADAIAAQLTEYLSTKESLTAPAVDKTLLIEGAAADAKVVGELKKDLDYKEKQAQNIIPYINLLDINKLTYGGYYDWINSKEVFSKNNNYASSDFIDVHNISNIIILECYTGIVASKASTIMQYDDNKQAIGKIENTNGKDYYQIPNNTSYIRLPVNISKYPRGYGYVVIAGTELPTLNKLYINGENIISHWYGKNWYAYGTSLTNTDSEGKYARFIDIFSGLIRTNRGVSGGGLCANTNLKNAIFDNDGKENADLITLECLANDGSATFGDVFDTDGNTFLGALSQCITHLQTNSNAQIVVIISPQGRTTSTGVPLTPTYRYADNSTYTDRANKMKKLCEMYGVYFINTCDAIGYNRKTDEYYVDHIHHTELGGLVFAKHIWEHLKNIPHWTK